VRKSGDRLRVTAQLVDTADGAHLWADRFDRHLEDLFDIQDDITKDVVTALQVVLTDGEKARVLARGTQSIAAWQYCVRARELQSRLTATHHLEARDLAEKAIEIDPDYAYAWGILGLTYFRDGRMDLGAAKSEKLARAQEIADRAVALDPTAPWGVGLTAMVAAAAGQHDEAIASATKAIEIQPGSAETRAFAAHAFAFSGLYAEAAEQTRIALSLDPFAPSWYRTPLLRSFACRDRFEEALEIADELLGSEPALIAARIWQIYCLDVLGQNEKTRASVIELRRHAPRLRTDHIDGIVCLADRDLTERITEAHRRAGLPDVESAAPADTRSP
jgi:adenylate cyclase